MTANLHVYSAAGQTLTDALNAFRNTLAQAGAVAMFYSPAKCQLAWMGQDGTLTNSIGEAIDLSPVYEARVFHEHSELRWLNDPSPQQLHRTAVLAVEPYDLGLPERPSPRPLIGTLQQTYLLWGDGAATTTGLANGWSRLATARIGKLDVPLNGLVHGKRVVLHAVEYLAEYDHGNVAVEEQLLVRLEIV